MADLISIHGWAYPAHRRRPHSPDPGLLSPNRKVPKSKSSNALADMAAASPLRVSASLLEGPSENSLSTLRDPRVASTSDLSKTISTSRHHPDLSSEVAALSDKLIQAINNQTTLDDTLAATRQELEASRNRIRQLELEAKQHEEDIAFGILVKSVDVEEERRKLKMTLAEERSQRYVIEKEKKSIEQELENLTAALFEEANKMVAAAKQEREAVERRNEQLRAQIKDTEMLLASHQEQLTELKMVMQQMTGERDESDTRTNPSTTPSSPGAIQSQDNINRLLEAMNLSPITPGSGDISPAPSTSFPHLIKSVCRTDIQAYDEFHSLLHLSKSSKPVSRAASGSYGGLNVMGLGNLSSNSHGLSNGSTTSLSGASAPPSSPKGVSSSPREIPPSHISLKETRFYKRALTEDIEPTLRLDIAPGISWLTRRAVLSSICEGGLIVEPMPIIAIKYSFACSLCGERRKGGENPRTHRFRTSDNESAQRYPLCTLCLEKMRSCCEFVGYLRLIIDGHIRIGDEDDEKEAWEETIRLRERMFWSRIGGGVVPAFVQTKSSEKGTPMSRLTGLRHKESIDEQPERCQPSGVEAAGVQPHDVKLTVAEDPFKSNASRASIGSVIISREEKTEVSQPEGESSRPLQANHVKDNQGSGAESPLTGGLQDAVAISSIPTSSTSPKWRSQLDRPVTPSRLRVTIPGAFEF